jgi:hypothetical protein
VVTSQTQTIRHFADDLAEGILAHGGARMGIYVAMS